ncbi:MAG: alpha-1,4-glucan--maltose-1-phosphate maltosyltransferase [Gemmatimonadaceae bacterium]
MVIECVTPILDGGRFPIKRIVGDALLVSADIFKDGHDIIAARVRYRAQNERDWRYAPMTHDYSKDRWFGGFRLDQVGTWTYSVEAWTDEFTTWRSELGKKLKDGQNVGIELLEGAALVDAAARKTRFGDARTSLKAIAVVLRDESVGQWQRADTAFANELNHLMVLNLGPRDLTVFDRDLSVVVDRERARFAAWYEMFPRSQGAKRGEHGTFASAERELDRIAGMGFDVVYLPPIHPIGVTNRKGRNNSLTPGSDDPGSPWAIGGVAGGHTAVEPKLGTLEDFGRFVKKAQSLGMEVALDYALQCSPDHPWLKDHPDWFFVRPDGSLKYAENPPKKYQDIYPLNFWCDDREALWEACRDIFLFWIERGVRTFRVDNPHTKPAAFWEWVISHVKQRHPDAIFLSEAFTRPKPMKNLAKLGFTQSYTYFTWRNSSQDLSSYLTELTQGPMAEYFKGNLFANTPDILHEYLQQGGRRGFLARALLATTLLPLYGIYSGFELCENHPLKHGSEEYLHSEKYEIKWRDWNARRSIAHEITHLNRVRRQNVALQLYTNLTFHHSDNANILFYMKAGRGSGSDLLIAVNLDPHNAQATTVTVPLHALGLGEQDSYVVEDLLTGTRYVWRGSRNYVRLDPAEQPGHLFKVVKR